MKKKRRYYWIGLYPDEGPFRGNTPEKRIREYALGLMKEKSQDGKSFLQLQKFINMNSVEMARNLYCDMDTSVRDTFFNAFTNNFRDEKATKKIIKILDLQFIKKRRIYETL